jgi:hypothetical protein
MGPGLDSQSFLVSDGASRDWTLYCVQRKSQTEEGTCLRSTLIWSRRTKGGAVDALWHWGKNYSPVHPNFWLGSLSVSRASEAWRVEQPGDCALLPWASWKRWLWAQKLPVLLGTWRLRSLLLICNGFCLLESVVLWEPQETRTRAHVSKPASLACLCFLAFRS